MTEPDGNLYSLIKKYYHLKPLNVTVYNKQSKHLGVSSRLYYNFMLCVGN